MRERVPKELRQPKGQSGIRTTNAAEIAVLEQLEAEGYEVLKRGWPDFIAVRGDEVRFIEVKPNKRCHLSQHQKRVARLLGRFGMRVELLHP